MAEQGFSVKTVGVAGLGLMGRSIVACLLANGFRVVAFTRPASGFAGARAHIESAIGELIAHGVVDASRASRWRELYAEAYSPDAFAACDFIVETITESLDAKRGLFAEIEPHVRPDVPIASNTSALPITLLQEGSTHPERIIGLHWAEPCDRTRFLEVIPGERTNEASIATAMSLGRALGKDPSLVRKDVNGFIVNRLGYAMYREALHLVEQGVADFETIDRCFRSAIGLWAAVAGPFRWMDLTGLPAYATVMERLLPELSDTKQVSPVIRALVDSGAEGIRNGRGFYSYTPEEVADWQRRYQDHVWAVRELQDREFPVSRPAND